MGKRYTQLTQEQRYQIYAFKKAGFNQTEIAKEIGVHKSTVSRELRRNKGKRGYRPKQAHWLAVDRKTHAAKFVKLVPGLMAMMDNLIRQEFSPEQVSGYLERHYSIQLSHETIYQYVLRDKLRGGDLYKHLRQGNKKRKKRYGAHSRRGQIKDRTSIDERPAIVEKKERVGDWEIDTMIGKNHNGVLLTIVERKSMFTIIKKLSTRHSESVACATIEILDLHKNKVHTITADNGKEFAQHKRISSNLSAQVYFAHPYHAWERGLNENINGLIRQYFPKGTNFEKIKEEEVEFVMARLNSRPRKSLGYATPKEVFYSREIMKAA
jgi:IS30 family transposase